MAELPFHFPCLLALTTCLYDGFLSAPVTNGSTHTRLRTKCIIRATTKFLWTDNRLHCIDLKLWWMIKHFFNVNKKGVRSIDLSFFNPKALLRCTDVTYLISRFPNCMQNVLTSVRLSWASGLKKPDLYYWCSLL